MRDIDPAIIVTGVAGFIGSHVAQSLLARGENVVGIDNLNDYYDPELKKARLACLTRHSNFRFHNADVADRDAVTAIVSSHFGADRIVHLAAQAGVRHSLHDPWSYTRTNVEGQLVMLEAARHLPMFKHFVYASSSSVYGGSSGDASSIVDRTDNPLSLYAATKKAGEHMAHSYAHLFGIPTTGLRFFTVYGPWGRPDMAAMIFIRKILAGEPIPLFNAGRMQRDFTYIDDIAAGVVAALDRPAECPKDAGTPARVYNLGNNQSRRLTDFVAILERELGVEARIDPLPMQPGDVTNSFADIDASRRDLGFEPTTDIEEGLRNLVDWYRAYYGDEATSVAAE